MNRLPKPDVFPKARTPAGGFWRRSLRYATALQTVLAVTLCSGAAQAQSVFSYDNGKANAFGAEPGGDSLALNHFNTGSSAVLVTEIGVLWNPISANAHPTVALYSDPNGDGDPSDMQPLLIYPIYIQPRIVILDMAVQYYSITPTIVNGSFFVGAFVSDQDNSSSLIGVDTAGNGPGQSWMMENVKAGQLSLQDPIATASSWENLDTVISGNHVIRAVYSPAPEPSAEILGIFGALCFVAGRSIRAKWRVLKVL